MVDYPTQRNLALFAMSSSDAALPRLHGGTVGPMYGRYTPWQTTRTKVTILAQVAQDVLAQDDAGIDYPAGQLWIRTYAQTRNQETGDYDDTNYWIAVPTTLPDGFTSVPWRNNRGAGGFSFSLVGAFQLDDGFSPQMFYPDLNTLLPIRLADGPYVPHATTTNPTTGNKDFIYGPCNIGGGVGALDFGGIGGGFPAVYTGYSPGYRNVRIRHFLSDADYAASGGGDAITTTLDGIDFVAHKSDFTVWGGGYLALVDSGPVALAATGAVKRLSIACSATGGLAAATVGIRASPRIDIPAPFWSSYGNLIAPGGIAAGTVPGY